MFFFVFLVGSEFLGTLLTARKGAAALELWPKRSDDYTWRVSPVRDSKGLK